MWSSQNAINDIPSCLALCENFPLHQMTLDDKTSKGVRSCCPVGVGATTMSGTWFSVQRWWKMNPKQGWQLKGPEYTFCTENIYIFLSLLWSDLLKYKGVQGCVGVSEPKYMKDVRGTRTKGDTFRLVRLMTKDRLMGFTFWRNTYHTTHVLF